MPVKTVTIQVNALTDRANADIRATGAYFDQLRAKNPVELKVKLDSAQAIAESKILAREMAQTVRDTVKLEADRGLGGGSLISRLLGTGAGGGGIASLVLGTGGTGAAGAAGIGPVGAGIGGAVGLAAIGSGALGIIPALAAAGAGVAAFGALAIPTFTAITGAISGVSAANAKFQEAAGLVDTAIQASAADMKIYKANLAALPPGLRDAEKLLGNTSVTWQDLTTKQQNNIIALSQNKGALAAMLPAQRTALEQLLASKAVWDQLSPAQQQIAKGWQNLTNQYNNLATALAPDVLKILNSGLKLANNLLPALLPIAKTAGDALAGLAGHAANFFQTTTQSAPPGWKPGEKLITSLTPFGEFMKSMTALSGPTITIIGEGIGKIAVAVGKLLIAMQSPDALKILKGLFDGLAGAIDLVAWAFTHGAPKIIQNFHDIADAFDHTRRFFAEWGHDIAHNFDGMRHDIALIWDAIWNNTIARLRKGIDDAAHDFDDFRHRTAVVFDGIRGELGRMWNDTWNNTIGRIQRGITDAVSWFRGMPGRLLNALSGLGDRLNSFAKNALNLLLEGFKSVANDIFGWFGGFVSKILGFFTKLLHHSPTGDFYHMGRNMMEGLAMGLKDHAHLVANALTGTVVPNVGSGVARWTGVVQEALRMEGLSEGLTRQVLYQISTESGGNPNAINLTDVNAQAGDPSRGLLQTIMATFQAYHWPGTSMNIYDPLANVAAAINYARHVYGPTLMANGSGLGSGHGYAYGGLLTEPVFGIGASGSTYSFGERGPEWIGPGGGGGSWYLREIVSLLQEVCDLLGDGNDITARAPVVTGAALGAGMAAGARAATYKALYS